MKLKQILPYKLRRMIPMICMAGATLLTSCEKPIPEVPDKPDPEVPEVPDNPDTEPYVPTKIEILSFDLSNMNDVKTENISKIAADSTVKTIYLNSMYPNHYLIYTSEELTGLKPILQEMVDAGKPKTVGYGCFNFQPGYISPEDSLWMVEQGWTVNQPQANIPGNDVILNCGRSRHSQIQPDSIKYHAQNPDIQNIFLNLIYSREYLSWTDAEKITEERNFLETSIKAGNGKAKGYGNFQFQPGLIKPADSTWFVENGWTVNKQLQDIQNVKQR